MRRLDNEMLDIEHEMTMLLWQLPGIEDLMTEGKRRGLRVFAGVGCRRWLTKGCGGSASRLAQKGEGVCAALMRMQKGSGCVGTF